MKSLSILVGLFASVGVGCGGTITTNSDGASSPNGDGGGGPSDASMNHGGDGGGSPDLTMGNMSITAILTAAPLTGAGPLSVTFSGCSSTDAGGTIVDYTWDFGDGTAASGPTATHIYSTGTYTVRLTVFGSQQASNWAQTTITVNGTALAPSLVTAPMGHPRLFYDAGHLAALQQRIARVPILGTAGHRTSYVAGYLLTDDWQSAQDYRMTDANCIDLIKTSFPTVVMENPVSAGRAISDCVATVAAGAALETDPMRASSDATAAIAALVQMANVWPQGNALTDGFGRWDCGACSDGGSNLNNGELLFSVAVSFDLLYAVMSPVDRTAVINLLVREARFLYGASLNKATWWSADTGNNWQSITHSGLGIAALVLEGEVGPMPGETDTWLMRSEDRIQTYLNVNYDPDGVNFEDAGHYQYGLEFAADFLLALKNVKADDRFSYRNSVGHNSLRYYVNSVEPPLDRSFPNDGVDVGSATTPVVLLLASQYRDGFGMWAWDRISGASRPPANSYPWKVGGDGEQSQLLRTALFYDDSVAIESPAGRLPLGAVFPTFGRALFRSAWDDPNALFLGVESGIFGSHGKPNQGHFILDGFGQHLADQGGGSVSTDYNVVMIDGKDQLMQDQLAQAAVTIGSIISPSLEWFGTDTTKAYAAAKAMGGLTHGERHFLFVQPTKTLGGYTLVFDDLSDSASHQFLWQMHPPVGATVAQVGPTELAATVGTASVHVFAGAPMGTAIAATQGPKGALSLLGETTTSTIATFVNALFPLAMNTTAPMVQSAMSARGLHVGSDVALVNPGAKLVTEGDFGTDGEVLFARPAQAGGIDFGAVISGTQLIDKGSALVTTSIPTSFVYTSNSDGAELFLAAITGAKSDLHIQVGTAGDYIYSIDDVVTGFVTTDGMGIATLTAIDLGAAHHIALRTTKSAPAGCN